MSAYRIFFLNRQKAIIHAQPIAAADDAEAINLAHNLPRDAITCELWDADRLVAKFDGRNGGAIQPS